MHAWPGRTSRPSSGCFKCRPLAVRPKRRGGGGEPRLGPKKPPPRVCTRLVLEQGVHPDQSPGVDALHISYVLRSGRAKPRPPPPVDTDLPARLAMREQCPPALWTERLAVGRDGHRRGGYRVRLRGRSPQRNPRNAFTGRGPMPGTNPGGLCSARPSSADFGKADRQTDHRPQPRRRMGRHPSHGSETVRTLYRDMEVLATSTSGGRSRSGLRPHNREAHLRVGERPPSRTASPVGPGTVAGRGGVRVAWLPAPWSASAMRSAVGDWMGASLRADLLPAAMASQRRRADSRAQLPALGD